MLAPQQPAVHSLRSWGEALGLLSARQTELQIAMLEIERARGSAREALGRTLPTLTATGIFTHHFIRSDTQTFDVESGGLLPTTVPISPVVTGSLTASVPILALREWYGVETAERAVEASRQRADDVERRTLANAAAAVLGVVTAEKLGEVNRNGLRASLERLELEQRRQKNQIGKRLDLLRIDRDVAGARAAVLASDEAALRAREALGIALGEDTAYGVAPDVSIDDIDRMLAAACKTGDAGDRPDVLAARTDLDLAERGVTDSKLAFAPRADLSTTATVSSDQLSNRKHYAWSVQAVLTWPIFDGGVRYGTTRRAEAVRDEAEVRLDATKRGVDVELAQASRAISLAEAQRDLTLGRRALAAESAALTQRAFEAGEATSFELVESARQAREADLELTLRDFDVAEARIAARLAAATCDFD